MRIALFSKDRELQKRLSHILGKDFEVLLERTESGIGQLLNADACHVCILHLSIANGAPQKYIGFWRGIISSQVTLIVVADEGYESTAAELVESGAEASFCNDGSFPGLQTLLRESENGEALSRQEHPCVHPTENMPCDALIGSSPQMQKVYRLIQLVADLNVSVFVTGESGTGKELIARAIHNLGSRSNQPFVAISCGAIPDTLFEAELFGHEKGAFTGTVGPRQGNFEAAGTGTLFLDEIGDLTMAAQVKLLRVLQQREFSRLGSNRLIPLRARLIFATHQDLDEMVLQGTFRQDLYYRLNVVRINAPALADHSEDIPQLVTYFLQQYCRQYKLPVADIHPQALSLLQSYSWPGNVRELEHVLQSAVVISRGETIRAEFLPAHMVGGDANVVDISRYLPEGSFEKQLTDYKIKLALAAVRRSNGNKTLAARSLNISRAYLHRLLRLVEEEKSDTRSYSSLEAISE